MSKSNKDVPLRVRVTAPEDERLMLAADKLGLTKSVYVRWAIDNSTTQVLGVDKDGKPMTTAQKPKAAKRQREVVEVVVEQAPATEYTEAQCMLCTMSISAEEAGNYNGCCASCAAPVPVVTEVVPDISTALGLPAFIPASGHVEAATFDDSDWEQ